MNAVLPALAVCSKFLGPFEDRYYCTGMIVECAIAIVQFLDRNIYKSLQECRCSVGDSSH
jgi:hypothetical protein